MDKKEKKNRNRGLIASFTVHLLFVLMALFVVSCWEQPGPPWPDSDFGVMIDFEDDLGTPAKASSASASAPQQTQEIVEEDIVPVENAPSDFHVDKPDEVVTPTPEPQPVPVPNPTPKPNPNPTPNPSPEPVEDPIDSDLLFSGDSDGKEKDGSNSKNNDSGKPKKGNGDGFSFEGDVGWDFIQQPPLKKNISHNGSVNVKVKITESGKLIVLGYPNGYGAFGDDDRKIIEASLQDANVYWTKKGLEEEKIAIIRFKINAQ